MFNSTMDINSIRLKNLDLIVTAIYSGVRARLAEDLRRQPSSISRYWSKTTTNRRNVDDVTAREVETLANKPRGWMDVFHSSFDDDIDTTIKDTDSSEQKLLRLFKSTDKRGQNSILALAEHEANSFNLPDPKSGERARSAIDFYGGAEHPTPKKKPTTTKKR